MNTTRTCEGEFGVFPLKCAHGEAGQVDVQSGGEVWEVPVLHHDYQIHYQDEGR